MQENISINKLFVPVVRDKWCKLMCTKFGNDRIKIWPAVLEGKGQFRSTDPHPAPPPAPPPPHQILYLTIIIAIYNYADSIKMIKYQWLICPMERQ